jgi:hypothetical protein
VTLLMDVLTKKSVATIKTFVPMTLAMLLKDV